MRHFAPSQKPFTPSPARAFTKPFLSAVRLTLVACASVSKTATPTVTATPSFVYVARRRRVQRFEVRSFTYEPWTAETQFFVSAVEAFLYTAESMGASVPGKRVCALSG